MSSIRDLARRLAAVEIRPANRVFRRVVIIGPNDPSPEDSDDIHIIRIVGVAPNGKAAWVLPHNSREPLPGVEE